MSLLSALFGCKATPLKGPDFDVTIPKALHIQPYFTVTYEMPGNMSNLMGFAARYPTESPRTIVFNTKDHNDFSRRGWKKALKIDGAIWEYNIKNRGSLNLAIEIVNKPESTSLTNFLKNSYEEHYNGENGINTEVRAENPNISDEELGGVIRNPPVLYKPVKLNGTESLSWTEIDEFSGFKIIYYAFKLDEIHTLFFSFDYSMSIKRESDIPLLEEKIQADIQEYMSRVAIEKN